MGTMHEITRVCIAGAVALVFLRVAIEDFGDQSRPRWWRYVVSVSQVAVGIMVTALVWNYW